MIAVFLGRMLIYILFIGIFVPILQYGIFELYMLLHRKTPDEMLILMEKTSLSKAIRDNYSTPSDRSDPYLKQRFEKFTYLRAGFMILFPATMIALGLSAMVKGLLEDAGQTTHFIASLIWLFISMITILSGLYFWKELSTKDNGGEQP